MAIIKADDSSEAGNPPSEEQITVMSKYNEESAASGVLLAAEGLYPSTTGARVHFKDHKSTVTDGPFTETKELIAGYWLLDVKSLDEALAWVRNMPTFDGHEAVVEVRRVFDAADFE
ncbi:YciI family protein [Umezawaea sp. NPDC059074]|uniref:YciI family protein n=1 Tax=Umezawaea sp. NPDC059074 TaxID=3346716 RepID=UPI00368B49E2